MSKLVVLAETNCIGYLRSHGFEPYEFYTDVEDFRRHSMYFNDVIVMILYTGATSFSRRHIDDICHTLQERIKTGSSSISDLVIVSDFVLPNCSDYFMYRKNPFNCIRYSGWKATSGKFDIRNLDYEHSDITKVYTTYAHKGYNAKALNKVRAIDETEADLINLIAIPVFE